MPPETKKEQAAERPHETLKLTDQYIALLLLVLIKAGLLNVSINAYYCRSDLDGSIKGTNGHAGRSSHGFQSFPKSDLAHGRDFTNGQSGTSAVCSS